MKRISLAAVFLCFSATCAAKDFGKEGPTFEITELSALTLIEQELTKLEANGTLDAMNQEFKENVYRTAERPPPVNGLVNATTDQVFYVDMSRPLEADVVVDDQVLAKAGTMVNPLKHRKITTTLIFIDGDNPEQVDFAVSENQKGPTKIILTKGAPLSLSREKGVWFYFDQGGSLSSRFNLRALPSVVTADMERLLMKVTEVAL
ncbi:hypothetical protein [Enterovibrio paralichthyis]|uniref:hypothetical protein n=1 Tax=Enterovibrio paralichthyis TaxID=2853805 RepID=UPI001C464C48|nr:hypothetical protein [Enterovibrio paralichthyis]MBV7300276.1 hypothetical protein [Enterovibrio paralichthyis]